MKYKILIVGLGNIGKRYFQGICKITDCKIDVFVFDNNPKSLNNFIDENKVYTNKNINLAVLSSLNKRFDLIIVKSPPCRPEFFDEWSTINFNIDAPGATSANLHSLGHTICNRPIFPLEKNTKFDPKIEDKIIW